MLRFSHFVDAVGKMPSTGKALTGKVSPLYEMIVPKTSRMYCGASSGIGGGCSKSDVT